jgi:hypothetical protein
MPNTAIRLPILLLSFCLILLKTGQAQTIKGLYVNGFNGILGNTNREDSLLTFAKNNGFNYLCLYDMHLVNASTPLNNATACIGFSSFVSKAKTQFGISEIGVAGENYDFFAQNIFPYNAQHGNAQDKIDVYNLEFEFWVPTSINNGGVYCIDYLTPFGFTCDSTGAFTYYRQMLARIDSLANAGGSISETYFGWFGAIAGQQIAQSGVDRILLSVYLPSANYSASYQYNYIKGRLQNLASAALPVKVLPIYSAEPSFMQTWASTNAFFTPYTDLQNSLAAETGTWKNYITLYGIQWFAYSYMPRLNMNLAVQLSNVQLGAIYPNPAHDKLFVRATHDAEFALINATGNVVCTMHLHKGHNVLDISGQPQGIYIAELKAHVGTQRTTLKVFVD